MSPKSKRDEIERDLAKDGKEYETHVRDLAKLIEAAKADSAFGKWGDYLQELLRRRRVLRSDLVAFVNESFGPAVDQFDSLPLYDRQKMLARLRSLGDRREKWARDYSSFLDAAGIGAGVPHKNILFMHNGLEGLTVVPQDAPGSKVYFAQSVATGLIKIGRTRNVVKRMKALKTGAGSELRVLATIRGGHADEKVLHRAFEAHKAHGEWFKPEGVVLEFLELLGVRLPKGDTS